MTNEQISIKADQIKVAVDAIKKSSLPKAVKDLAILEAKKEIQQLKKELEFNKEYEDTKRYIQQGKEEMKKMTLAESPMFTEEEFRAYQEETRQFRQRGKEKVLEAHKRFDEQMKNFWD